MTRVTGFSLIEVIISMSLLAMAMVLLATLALSAGRRGRLNDLTTKRNLALAQQVARIETMPFNDVMLLVTGTTQMLVGDFNFNRQLTVVGGASAYQIRIAVTPISGEFKPDSVTIYRLRPASGTPLCTTC